MHGNCTGNPTSCYRHLPRSELVVQPWHWFSCHGQAKLCCCCRTQDCCESYEEAEGFFFEDLRNVKTCLYSTSSQSEEMSVVRLKCFMPKHVAPPTDVAVIRQLRTLLLAHEATLTQQRLEPSTPLVGLTQTFDALLELVREMQGIRVHIVYLTPKALRDGVEAPTKQVLSTPAGTEMQEWPDQLQAYEMCLASLATLKLDAVGLATTFKPLLKTLSDRAGVIEPPLPPRDLNITLPDDWHRDKSMELLEVPEDLRRLKHQIAHLVIASNCIKTLPSWLSEFHLLETLELHCGTQSECPLKQLPCFSGLTNLRALKISLDKLESLPDTIGEDLKALTSLHLLECSVLQILPPLPVSVTTLHLRNVGCEATDASGEEIPSCIRRLTSLTDLAASSKAYRRLPDWISELKNLKRFTLGGPDESEFTRLPDELGRLVSLQFLELCALHNVAVLPTLERLTSLKGLAVSFCDQLQELPALPVGTLQTLMVENCDNMQRLPPISTLMGLQKLTLHLEAIRELPANFGQLTALRKLKLNLPSCEELPASVGSLTGIKSVEIMSCKFNDLPTTFKDLTSLNKLTIFWGVDDSCNRVCETLASLLLTFRELKELTLSGSWTWTSRTETTTLACGITSIRTISSSHHVHEEGEFEIARSLKARSNVFETPILVVNRMPKLKRYWQALALPAEAVGWDNKTILNYFACELLNKANKILAFAQGLHARLGAVSRVSCLNDSILTIIGNEVSKAP
mmetsp:Transcript_69337/g.101599  ORF Transcript_69337/g.101599 Transcript_69337/m.101599 type:complete len:743 (+) Transcript_69337:509-2737(+)